MNNLVFIIVSGILGTIGQIIMKQGTAPLKSMTIGLDTIPSIVVSLAFNPLVVLGVAVYVSGTFFWLVALSRVDLSYAYPFASINYLFILFASWLVLGEQPSPTRIVGVMTICIGVWAISRTPSKTTIAGDQSMAVSVHTASGDLQR